MSGLLDKERTVAKPGFNRWLVPPAALAIHLSIGMAYGFSVFWLPLSRAIGITQSAPGDWKISTLGWMYTLFFVFLGTSAAVFGRWLERNGPRKAGVAAAFCWGGGFFISALGVHLHQIALLWIGSGVIGGCGLGLGYISPVSTLIKWFPDKRGMATGMAIMGFGGGAMIGAPLADRLIKLYATPASVGVKETFLTLGVIYFAAMLIGAFLYRIPPAGWTPAGWTPPAKKKDGMITHGHVHIDAVHKIPQFWLLWAVLCLNVSAGIGIIGMASPMLQEVFGGKLIGLTGPLASLSAADKIRTASIGAGFAGLLSLFNIAGRFFWASMSDYIGRKRTYVIFFALGAVLYAAAPFAGGRQERGPLRRPLLCHPDDVRRRLRHHPRLSRRPLRHPVRRGHSRPAADRLVHGRHPRAGPGQLHPGVPAEARDTERGRLQHDPVHPGRPAPAGFPRQHPGQAGRGQALHVGRGAGA